jgi:hypothetical protein
MCPSASQDPKVSLNAVAACGINSIAKLLPEITYTHHICGNPITIAISRNIIIPNLSKLELETVGIGDWEVPEAGRRKGHIIMAYSHGKAIPQYLMGFDGMNLTDPEIVEFSHGLAKFLGTPLVVMCRQKLI